MSRRSVDTGAIGRAVRDLCLLACTTLDEALLSRIRSAMETERSEFGRDILSQMLKNADLAREKRLPICQDTGMAVVFLDIGQQVSLEGEDLSEQVNQGVRDAYREGCFRNSVLTPLERKNTGDNTPAILHTRIVPGDKVDITVAPKGFGSENMSRIAMLMPAQGRDGVVQFVLETVSMAGANPCPPVVVGVGIGGTMEYAALLSKRALLRQAGQPSSDPQMRKMEEELLCKINCLGIGPQGLGGDTTALAVHIEHHPTHIAGLPVAVNMQCHVARHAHTSI